MTRAQLKNIRSFCAGLFIICAAYLAYFYFAEAPNVAINPYNKRLTLAGPDIKRGKILSSGGDTLAETVYDGESETRVYPYGAAFAHIVGFDGPAASGAEARYSLTLKTPDHEILRRTQNLLFGSELTGSSVALTLDTELQLRCAELLGGRKGCILAAEIKTGKVLACVSGPGFDPESAADAMDDPDSPLINRAFTGLYPPGSVFKIVTATAAMRYLEPEELSYECASEDTFEGRTIRCYNKTAHGALDLKEAFAVSCNTYFARLAMLIGGEYLTKTAEDLLFNKKIDFGFEHVSGSFYIEEGNAALLAETGIGQGLTVTTPLHMAVLVSAAANGGVAMRPYILDHIVAQNRNVKGRTLPKTQKVLFSADEAENLMEMMRAVTERGTGRGASPEGFAAAGKTGSAENPAGEAHGWFAGVAPADGPKIAIVVLLENSGGSRGTLPIVNEIIGRYFEK